jgi:GNAT superfamily N-acetyltransferase
MQYEPFSVDRLKEVLSLCIAMQKEGDFSSVPFDIEVAANSIVNLVINNPNGFGMLALDDDGHPVGMISGSVNPYLFSRGSVASDFAWYVKPEFRGSRISLRLLKSFTEWAKERGADNLYMGVSTNVTADRTGEVLKRRGFEHVGGNYRMRLNAEL